MKQTRIKNYDKLWYNNTPVKYSDYVSNKYNDIHKQLYNDAVNKLLNDIAEGRKGTVIKEFNTTEEKGEERQMNEGKLYRNAFLKNLLGQKLTEAEERAFVHTTENTEVVVPTELQNKIYSTMEEKHPILADIQYLRTGAVLSIVKFCPSYIL